MSNYKYTFQEIDGKQYIRGWSVWNELPDFVEIFLYEPEMLEGR